MKAILRRGALLRTKCFAIFVGVLWTTVAASAEPKTLTTADEIRHLSPESANANLPVKVRGVVTYCQPDQYLAFVQDETGGVYFQPEESTLHSGKPISSLRAGTEVEIIGRTIPGGYAPCIGQQIQVSVVGKADFPDPLSVPRTQLVDPKFDMQWVELEGTVCETQIVDGRRQLQLACNGQQFDVMVDQEPAAQSRIKDLLWSDVRIRGVYGSIVNEQRQLIGFKLYVPSIDQIQVIDPGFSIAYSRPAQAVTELMRFHPEHNERVRLRGVVLASFPGGRLFIRGEGGSIQVETLTPGNTLVGQELDLVGFPEAGSVQPVLRDTIFRATDYHSPPLPVDLAFDTPLVSKLHGELVRVEARVVDHLLRPSDSTIVLESAVGQFYANVPHGGVRVEKSTWLALTGICILQPNSRDGRERPGSDRDDAESGRYTMSLLVRGDADLVILQGPSWWTIQKIGMIAAAFALMAAAMVGWSFLLRRQVKEQTQVIIAQVENRKVVEERARIARELHDTLEQELIGVTIQLDNASARLDAAPDRARESLNLARAMLRHSQAQTRRSVWDLRATVVDRDSLASTMDEIQSQLQTPGGAEISVHIDEELPTLPGRTANHLLRVAQEALTNAIKHADPNSVSIELARVRGSNELCLRVLDDGTGFDPGMHPDASDGHFGLSGMQERAGKLGGVLRLESELGQGTTVTLTVAMADAARGTHKET